MATITRKAVYEAVRSKLPSTKQRAALSQKLGKPWHHASTEAIAQAIGLEGAPHKPSKNAAHAIAHRFGVAKTFAADSVATKLAGEDQHHQIQVRQRIVRAVNREMRAKAKELGRKLTPAEKRAIAVKALHAEVQAIKAGKPEQKPQRGKPKAADQPMAKNNIVSLPKKPPLTQEAAETLINGAAEHLNRILDEHKDLLDRVGRDDYGDPNSKAWRITSGDVEAARQKLQLDGKAEPEKPASTEPPAMTIDQISSHEDRAKFAEQEAKEQQAKGNHLGAAAWEEEASKARKAAIKRDLKTLDTTQTSLFGVTEHSSDMPLFNQSEPEPEPAKPTIGQLAQVPTSAIKLDPERFQYKVVHGKGGETGSLTGVKKWDPDIAGIIQVWHDPQDGQDYAVNGHNRAALANRLQVPTLDVRYIHAKDATEARAIGALTNIAEGHGNALDAAKFFKDSGLTQQDLEARGIPLKSSVATDGVALSQLEPSLFNKVVSGELPQERAVTIGSSGLDHTQQRSLMDLIDQQEKRRKHVTNDTIRELSDGVKAAQTSTDTQIDLFGSSEVEKNNAVERASLQAEVKKKLSRAKNLFGTVSSSRAASELEQAGNKIDVDTSHQISKDAELALNVFDRLKNQTGPVSDAINRATERIANGEDRRKVTNDLHQEILTTIPAALGLSGKGSSGERSETPSVSPSLPAAGAGELRSKPITSSGAAIQGARNSGGSNGNTRSTGRGRLDAIARTSGIPKQQLAQAAKKLKGKGAA